jgi:hypothetical protein
MTTISATIPCRLYSTEYTAMVIKFAASDIGIDVEIHAYMTNCKIVFRCQDDLNLIILAGILIPLDKLFVGKKAYKCGEHI